MEIRTVKDEKFQDIEQYINRLVQYVESLEDLTFVTTKNAKYMVCKLDKTTPNVFALIKNDGKELKDYLVQLDEKGNIVHFTGGRTEYNINNEGLERIVQKVDIDTLKLDQVFYSCYPASQIGAFYYQQIDDLNAIRSSYQYFVDARVDDPNYVKMVTNYLNGRGPNLVVLDNLRKFLGFISYTKENAYASQSNYGFTKVKRIMFTNKFVGLNTGLYFFDDILHDTQLSREIPQDLLDLYTGNSKEVNELKEVVEGYKAYHSSKK